MLVESVWVVEDDVGGTAICGVNCPCCIMTNYNAQYLTLLHPSGPLEKSFKSTAHYAWTVLLVMAAMLVINHFLFASGSLVYPLLFFCVWVYCRTPAMRNSISDVFGLFKMPTACVSTPPSHP